uniref:Chemokine interleukin-8-like domain-containing protein n=1 Tax=Gouania willdenowi TaxID=441366 RepID=A0A8C5EXL8_GOUWI
MYQTHSTLLLINVIFKLPFAGHPAARSERCLCTGRSLVNTAQMIHQKDLETVLQDSVLHRPSMFCTKTEITIGKKCVSSSSPLGRFIIRRKVGREPGSR